MNGSSVTQPIQTKSIEEWTEVLCEQEMPIFSNTANTIYATLDDKKKGAMELASIILQDPNLTAKLLRVSNSSYYNPSRQPINTVSRAIVILGAATIRELTLACSFFESILSSDNKERANEEIAHAIHAAVQAKALAVASNDPSPEGVFIAALLHNIGKIAFWCFSDKQALQINELIESGGYTIREAEIKVLGFSLQQLSKRLSQSWHLGGLIEEAIHQPDADNPRIRLVQLGHEISQASKAGDDSAVMQQCLKKLSHVTGLANAELETRIKRCTAQAIKTAIQFGAHDASKFIDASSKRRLTPPDNSDSAVGNKVDKKQVQFRILEEISSHISGAINLNILFELVLEGIHRGVGMDRTLFLLLGADKKSLHEKFYFGRPESAGSKIQLRNNGRANLFFHSLETVEGIWANPQQHRQLYTPQIMELTGHNECFVIPVATEQKVIGMIYCDRAISQASLNLDDFDASKHFAKQACIGLTLYRMRSL
ncbi:HDOD domain-containing protein [Methylomarinum sp. Ch1-1]|uniref:HDOD domain-containing protein n=1 Tax=Methylomarinum roseum TaxID=3067653 RepID=A0AAU7NXY5_9GAMM|nr:HDOD domain-containing protein [Methylomarinum sp. Ch1-1]MDP4522085.1 HDOD domain-containing protein [Methylomarinum sp. Ch1-1]